MNKLDNIVGRLFRRIALPIVLVTGLANAQDYTVNGTVRSMNTHVSGTPIQNVKVEADSGKSVAFTDINGNYSLRLPSGTHNLRVVKIDKRGWQQNYTLDADTTLNFSLPDTVQNVPMGSAVLKSSDIKESYTSSGSSVGGPGNPLFWKTLPVPIFISNATPLDSATFKQYISSGTGDWTKADSGSGEWAMQRPLYVFTTDSVNAKKNGVIVKCQGSTNGTTITPEIQNGTYTGYIQHGVSTVGFSDPVAFQHELLGQEFDKAYVFSRVSNMNGDATVTWTVIDNLINWVGENYKLSSQRGENFVDLFAMIDYHPSSMSQPVVGCDSQSISGSTVNAKISWSPILDVDNYRLQVAADTNFTRIILDSLNIHKNNASVLLNTRTKYYVRTNASNSVNTSSWSSINSFTTDTGTDVVELPPSNIPKIFELCQNYPNPFNPETNIEYTVPCNSDVLLKVYDLLGREVTTLVDKRQNAGTYKTNFNARNKASGIYFYRIEEKPINGKPMYVQAKKMVFTK